MDPMSRTQSTPGWSAHRVAARSASARSAEGGLMPAASRACDWLRAQAGNRSAGMVPSTSWARSDSATAGRPASRCSGRSPTSSGSAQNTSLAVPSGAGISPQVMATSIRSETSASVSPGSHIRCTSTVTWGAWSANRPIRWGASTAAPSGVIPTRTVPASPPATRRTAARAAVTSSRMTFDRASSSLPALVSATRRVVRVNRGVPSSRSRRRISSLSVGATRCSRSAARPKCSSVATATNASSWRSSTARRYRARS